jgi:ubiquinol-cytochrome c reductase cytochrome c subunit
MGSVRGRSLWVVALVLGVTAVGTLVSQRATAQTPPPQQTPPPEAQGNPDTGRALYQQDCAVCHGPAGEGSFRGPDLRNSGTAAVDFMLTTGRMPITAPKGDIPRSDPKYSTDQIKGLVAYVSGFVSGPPVPDVDLSTADVAKGGDLYRLNCASCHQSVGAGGALAYGTTAPALDQATPVQVVEAMRVGPGSMPVFSPDQITDADAADLTAYVQYIRQPDDRGGIAFGHFGPVPEGLVAWAIGLGSLLLYVRWLGTRERAT